MHHAPLLALTLLSPAIPQEPGARPPAEDRIVIRRVIAEQPILAGQVRVASRRIFLQIDGKTIQMEDQPQPPDDEGDEEPVAQIGFINIQAMAFSSANFDRVVFGSLDLESRRKALHRRLARSIGEVGRERPLDAAEWRRLELAGTGDIERFLGRVEAARAEFEAARFDFNRGREAIRGLAALGREFEAGPFGRGSLFRKVSGKSTLDDLLNPFRLGRPPIRLAPAGR